MYGSRFQAITSGIPPSWRWERRKTTLRQRLHSAWFALFLTVMTGGLHAQKSPASPHVLANKSLISAAAYSPDGKTLATGGYRIVTLRETKSGKSQTTLPGGSGVVTS